MTSKQRAYLRGLANTIQPIFQIGKGGISDNVIKQIDDALEARELIKVTVLDTASDEIKDICKELEGKLGLSIVQIIGSKMVLYRKSKKNSKIELPR